MKLENIQQINQDILIHKNYVQSALNSFTTQDKQFFNSTNLFNALKKRNEQFNKNVDRKGTIPIPQPLRQLSQRAIKQTRNANYKSEIQRTKREIAREYTSQLFWQKFTMANQQDYVDKHQQFLIHKMIGQSFKAYGNTEKMIKNNLFNNLKGINDEKAHSPSKIRNNVKSEDQLRSNKYVYHDYIKRKVLSNQQIMQDISQFIHLSGEVSQIWQILFEHIKSYDYAIKSQKPNPHLAVVNASISMIEAKFRQQLPSLNNQKQINEYMRKKYILGSRSQNYQTNQEGLLIWAIPYAFYKVGAWSHFASSLSDRGRQGIILRDQFFKLQQSITSYDPTPQYFGEGTTNDIFYQQLVRIAKGITEYDEMLCALGSYDLIWLALKTLKMYEYKDANKRSESKDITNALINYFRHHSDQYISRSTAIIPYAQFLYLTDYKAFMIYRNKSNSRQGLTTDDYVHLLLAMAAKPEIVANQQLYEDLLQELQLQLQSYISNLLITNSKKQGEQPEQQRHYAVFYLMCIPSKYFKDVLTAVFPKWDKFNEINNCIIEGVKGWKYIKFRYQFALNSHIFDQAVLRVFTNMLSTQPNSQVHLKIVETAEQLLSEPRNYLNFVLLCQTNHLLKLKQIQQSANRPFALESEQKQKGQLKSIYHKLNNMLRQIINNDVENELAQFVPIIQFLQRYCSLEDVKHEKHLAKLENFLKYEDYVGDLILLASRQDNRIKSIYDQLLQLNADKLLFAYVKNVIYGKQRVNHMRGNYSQLKNFREDLKTSLQKINRQTNYNVAPYVDYLGFGLYQ